MLKQFDYDLFDYKWRYQKERANAALTSVKELERFCHNNTSLITNLNDTDMLISELKDCVYNNKPTQIVPLVIKFLPYVKRNNFCNVQPSSSLIIIINRLIFQSYYLSAPAGLLKDISLPDECLLLLEDIYIKYLGIPEKVAKIMALKFFSNHYIGNNRTDRFTLFTGINSRFDYTVS